MSFSCLIRCRSVAWVWELHLISQRSRLSFSLELRILCWKLYIQEEREQEQSGGVLKARPGMMYVIPTCILSGECSHTASVKAREQGAFLCGHVTSSLPHMTVQRERSGEGTQNIEKQPLCEGNVSITLVN